MALRSTLRAILTFQEEVNNLLGTHETSVARVVNVERTYEELQGLSLKQDDLFRQALRATEHGLFRSAMVMSWAALLDFIEEKLGEDRFVAVNREYTKWGIKNVDDLRDKVTDFGIVEAGRKVSLYPGTVEKSLKALLSRRNEAAHPSEYYPGFNEALGYISEVLQRVKYVQARKVR